MSLSTFGEIEETKGEERKKGAEEKGKGEMNFFFFFLFRLFLGVF